MTIAMVLHEFRCKFLPLKVPLGQGNLANRFSGFPFGDEVWVGVRRCGTGGHPDRRRGSEILMELGAFAGKQETLVSHWFP